MKTTKRYNVVLVGCQQHIKDRMYDDLSFEDVLYILENNTNRDFLRSNGIEVPSIEKLNEYQDMSSEYSVLIEEYKPSVTCDFIGIDYPDYFTGYGYMRQGFCVPLFQQRYTGLELSRLIQEETDEVSYEFSNEQIGAIYYMCAKFDTELKDEIIIALPNEAIGNEYVPNAYFVFND